MFAAAVLVTSSAALASPFSNTGASALTSSDSASPASRIALCILALALAPTEAA